MRRSGSGRGLGIDMGAGAMSVASIAFAIGIIVGCDDKPAAVAPPPAAATQPAAAAEAARPTARQLLAGPQEVVQLSTVPLSVRLPAGWKAAASSDARFTFLRGPLPAGEAEISVAQWGSSGSVTKSVRDKLIAGLKDEAAKRPARGKVTELNGENGLAGFEQIGTVAPSGPAPAPAAVPPDAAPPASMPALVDWTTVYFVPNGEKFDGYSFTVVGLGEDELPADEPVIRAILGSVKRSTPPVDLKGL